MRGDARFGEVHVRALAKDLPYRVTKMATRDIVSS